jgi:opacity protein-like surface antigen
LFAFNALLGTSSTNDNDPSQAGTTWFGAGAYAKYQFNDWFSLCSRGEYLGGNNPAKVSTDYKDANLSLWEYTLTAGFNVIDNLLIRAEYRLDWGNNSVNNFGNTTSDKYSTSSGPAHYAGAEVVYSF